MGPHTLPHESPFWNFTVPGICDPLLALCSMLLGGSAAYVVLSIAERMRASDQGHAKLRWLSIGAVAAGLEIWSIHFIGNRAFCLPIPAIQDILLSIIYAGAAGAVAVYLINSHDGSGERLVVGGLGMGVCLSMAHFTSMMAIHQALSLQTDVFPFVLSIGVIVALSFIVVSIGAWNIARGGWRVTEKASAMGLALSGAHFVGMIPVYNVAGVTNSSSIA